MVESKSDLKCEILADDFTQYDLSFKLIVIGDSGVGKSCLTLKATKNFYEEFYTPTVGFEFFTQTLKIDNKYIKLQIWDTCGQEIYRSLIASFYRNSSLAIMVYSIDNGDSFDHIDSWLKEVKTQANPDVKIFLIGNKTDKEEERKVPKEAAENFAKDNGLDLCMETSAKTGFNVKNVFMEAGKILYLEHLKYKDRASRPGSMASQISTVKLPKPESKKNGEIEEEPSNKKGCC